MLRVVDCHAGVLGSIPGGPKRFPSLNYFTSNVLLGLTFSWLLDSSHIPGSTANWLITACLLCKVRDFSWALRLSCKLLRTDDHYDEPYQYCHPLGLYIFNCSLPPFLLCPEIVSIQNVCRNLRSWLLIFFSDFHSNHPDIDFSYNYMYQSFKS